MRSITSIQIEGFRSLKNVFLEPGRVTVLIGPNGAGKSNVLSALRLIRRMKHQTLRRDVAGAGGASALLYDGPSVTREILLRVEFQNDELRSAYLVRLGFSAGDKPFFIEEATEEIGAGTRQSLGSGHYEPLINAVGSQGRDPAASSVRAWLDGMSSFHFHDTSDTAPLRRLGRPEDVQRFHSDGSNLASYLHSLASGTSDTYRAAWARINMLIRRVAPFIERLEPAPVLPDQPDRSSIRLNWIDERGKLFGVEHLSDGTVRAIALFTALGQPLENLPAFITIDEPELGLHPTAISLLAAMIHSISNHCQVLIATQSPALLDEFDPAHVVIVDRKDNATVLERLKPEELATWLEDYTLSEIWDKNLIGGLP